MEKDVEEMIGGYLVVLRYASLHETSFQWDKLTLKKGSRAGGGQKKKCERANNAGQAGGTCETHRPRRSWRCAVLQTKKNRFPDCPKRSPGPLFLGGGETAYIGRVKEGKNWKSEVPGT